MRWLVGPLAEWQIARVRLLRTRLGLSLSVLDVVLVALAAHRSGPGPTAVAILAAMLGGVLAVAFTLGSDLDRAGLAVSLTHPTTPGAVLIGRWVAATVLGGTAGAMAGFAATLVHPGDTGPGPVLLAGGALAAAAGTAAWTVAAVAVGGNVAAAALFIYMAALGDRPADRLRPVGAARAAIVLPAPWRYEGLPHGEPTACAHVACSILVGLALGRWKLARCATGCRFPS